MPKYQDGHRAQTVRLLHCTLKPPNNKRMKRSENRYNCPSLGLIRVPANFNTKFNVRLRTMLARKHRKSLKSKINDCYCHLQSHIKLNVTTALAFQPDVEQNHDGIVNTARTFSGTGQHLTTKLANTLSTVQHPTISYGPGVHPSYLRERQPKLLLEHFWKYDLPAFLFLIYTDKAP